MKKLLVLVSIGSLLLTLIPAFLVISNIISLEMNKNLMLIGTLGWFLTAPYWMNKKTDEHH
jgi:hypothetical protein